MDYFNKLPTISYDGQISKNLLARARLSDNIRGYKTSFYPYTTQEGDRIDILSNDYYNNPGLSWLIWLTNKHIDPYYDVAISESELSNLLIKKYGSLRNAQRGIKLYRNNWYTNTDEQLTVSGYNSLTSSFKKYYEPVVDTSFNVSYYKRKRNDTLITTNKIVSIDINNVVGQFEVGEEIQTNSTNYATVTFANSSSITCQHVVGTLSGTIAGINSSATANVVSTATLAETLAGTDPTYWEAVTFFDYETELNEGKRYIKLLDPRFAGQASNDLRRIMRTK